MFWRKESLEMHQGYAAWMLRTVTIKGCGDDEMVSSVAALLHNTNTRGDTSPLF